MKMKYSIFTLLMAVAVFFTACSSGEEKAEGNQPSEKFDYEAEQAEEAAADEEEETTYFLPSALQIGSVFQRSGLKYSEGIVNPPNNVSKYDSKTSKLLNFGTYSADLAYCVLNGQNQVAMNQLRSLQQLASGIGMESIFNSEALFSKFEKNMGNQDSIIDVMVQIQENVDMFVDDNNMQSMANIIFAGAWIEGMYIGVKAASDESEKKITSRLVEQMIILDNLIMALDDVDNKTDDLNTIHNGLKDLQTYFQNIPAIKSGEKVNFKEMELSMEDLKNIADKIVSLRKMIVKAE